MSNPQVKGDPRGEYIDRISSVCRALDGLSQLLAVSRDEGPKAEQIALLMDPHIEVLKQIVKEMNDDWKEGAA